ncbi:MAG TPA: hypothetical protein VMV79_02740 [Alphaproteobacteria bacterium]|nr:hypothetical protein [Alphaproteobacteria bacterium]
MTMTSTYNSRLKPAVPMLVVSLIALLGELVELLNSEPDLVLGRKLDAHRQLLKRKQKLALDYRTGMKSLMAQPDLLKNLPEDTRRVLRTLGQKLADSAERNARALRTAVVATQRLIQNIITAVKDEVLPKGAYKNPAQIQGAYSPTCTPVAVRRSV